MKIDGWHIDGYGVHADLHVTDLPDGLTIIAGPNESGKTTLQHFLVGMLFGFTAVNRPDHHLALRGGTYGGRLFITTDDGQHLTIHRGARKSSLKVTTADGTPYEGDLGAVLGGASKELFQSVFAVHLADLAELRALTEDQVRDRVFSAGILGAGRSAQTALGQLGDERDALLKPNGRGERYRLKELRSQLADARLRLDEARRESQALPAHLRQLELLEDRAATHGAEADRLRSEAGLLAAVSDLWPRWSAATDARHQLDQLGPVPDVAADAGSRLHTAIALHESAADGATRAADELAAAEQAVAAGEAPTLEPEALDQIERLARQVDTERDRTLRIEELTARAAHQRTELEAELAVLGAGRDQAWLDARPVGASDASGLRQAAGAVAEARADLRDATRAVDQLATDLADEAAELRRAEAALDDLPTLRPSEAIAGLDAATALAALATQREVAARRLAEAEARRTAPPSPASGASGSATALVAAGAAAVVAGVAAVATGNAVIGSALLATGAVLAVAGIVLRTRRAVPPVASDVEAVIELATDDVRRIDDELTAPLAVLRLDAVPTAAEAAAIRAHADRLAAGAQQAEDQRRRTAEDLARHQDRAARQRTAADQRLQAAATRVHESEQGWAAWLTDHDLPADLDPAGANEFLSATDRARATARTLALTDADLQAQRSAADQFADAVRALSAQLGELGEPDLDPVVLTDRLATKAAQQRQLHRAAATAAAELERAATAERRAGRARAEANERLTAELQALGAPTAAEAVALLDRAATAATLRAAIDDADSRLDAAAGTDADRRVRALELLTGADPARWAADAQAVRRRLVEVTEDRDQCLHDQAVVRAEIQKLHTSADVPSCELRVAGLEAELVEAVTTWATLTLAHQMVEGTLARYQRERQPDVVKRAAALFEHVTGGAYVRVEVRDNDVFAIDHAGRECPAGGLSQGATEQLYLCMRIALAESFAKTASLPLLLDDITVNADPVRQQQLSELLATVAERQQVFAFTCHPTVVDQLRQLRPEAKVVTLQPHRAVTGRSGSGPSSISLAAG